MARGAGEDGPHPVDRHVGRRVCEKRISLGYNQSDLGRALGLTFQQIQKYERGANRVSASKLFEISKALKASVSFFYDHLVLPGEAPATGVSEDVTPEFRHDFIMTPEGMELAKAFPRIGSRKMRRQVLDLVKALAEESENELA